MSPNPPSRSNIGSSSESATPLRLYRSDKLRQLPKTGWTSSKAIGKMWKKEANEVKREYVMKAELARHAHRDRSSSRKSQPLLPTRVSRRTRRHAYPKPSHSDDSEQHGSLSSSSPVSQDTLGNIPLPTPITPRLPPGDSGTLASFGNVFSSAAVPPVSSLDQQQTSALQNGAIFPSMSAASGLMSSITSSGLPPGIPQVPMEVLQFLRIWCGNYEQAVRSQTSTSDVVINTTSASLGFNLESPSLNHPLAASITSADTSKTPGDSNIVQMDEAPDTNQMPDDWFKPSPEEFKALMTELGIPIPPTPPPDDNYLSTFFNLNDFEDPSPLLVL